MFLPFNDAPGAVDELLVAPGAGEVAQLQKRYPGLDADLIRIVIQDHGPMRANVDNVLFLFQQQKYRDPLRSRI